MRKLGRIKSRLKRWNKEVFGNLKEEKVRFERRIQEINRLEEEELMNISLCS